MVGENDPLKVKEILMNDLKDRFDEEDVLTLWFTIYGSYRDKVLEPDNDQLMVEKYVLVYEAVERRLNRRYEKKILEDKNGYR